MPVVASARPSYGQLIQQETERPMDSEVDVLIVGARCAGSPLAMLLGQLGHRVMAIDRARFPSDRLSTHLLLHKGVHFLQEWGLWEPLLARSVPAVTLQRFNFGEWWIDIGADDDEPHPVCAPRRIVLDELLVEAARAAGATIVEQTRYLGLLREDGRVVGAVIETPEGPAEVRARIVVGADGLHSKVARDVEASVVVSGPESTCLVYGYWEGVEQDYMELGLRPRCGLGAVVSDSGLVLVSVLRPLDEWRELWSGGEEVFLRTLREWFPMTADRVAPGRRVSPMKGTNVLPNFIRQNTGPGWALVGDAWMHKDPITGLGISDAFHAAAVLAEELHPVLPDAPDDELDEALSRYGERIAAATRPTFDVACRCARHDFTDAELPAIVMALQDAIGADIETVAGADSEPLIVS